VGEGKGLVERPGDGVRRPLEAGARPEKAAWGPVGREPATAEPDREAVPVGPAEEPAAGWAAGREPVVEPERAAPVPARRDEGWAVRAEKARAALQRWQAPAAPGEDKAPAGAGGAERALEPVGEGGSETAWGQARALGPEEVGSAQEKEAVEARKELEAEGRLRLEARQPAVEAPKALAGKAPRVGPGVPMREE